MPKNEELDDLIWQYSLLNAFRHRGKAHKNAVLGKILSEKPELKHEIKNIIPHISRITKEVNNLHPKKQKEELLKKWPDLLREERVREEKVLPPLQNKEKYAVITTRFSPNPDCVLHFGSLRAIILSYEYAKMYKGQFILRFDDTDPRLKKSSLEFYNSIREDLTWLGCLWDQEHFQSDRIPLYYEHGERLLKNGGGYICTCQKDKFKELLDLKKACQCRGRPFSEQLNRWKNMTLGGFQEGEAVFRVITDLSHPNPAVRDWPAFRIINPEKNPHPRVGSKYRVWPLYNFASAIDDHLLNITHIVRGKEHLTNTLRQKYLYNHFQWKYPVTIHYGRLKIAGADLSKSKILRSVKTKKVKGFDDPQLATLVALRRRGFKPESLKKMIIDIGIKPVDVTISWDNVFSYNRKLIDRKSNRYFYVEDPVPLEIEGVQKRFTAKIPLHPDYPERGNRKITINQSRGRVKIYVSKADLPLISSSKVIRLIGLFNIEPINIGENSVRSKFHSHSINGLRSHRYTLIQWVKSGENIDVGVVMCDGSVSRGVAEISLRDEKVGHTIQLVRFGFARIDDLNEKLITLYYSHG